MKHKLFLYVSCALMAAFIITPLAHAKYAARPKYHPKTLFAHNVWSIPLSKEPFWFTLDAFKVKIHVPPGWQNHVKLVNMRLTTGDLLKGAYGFVLSSRDVEIEAEQYVGVLVIYNRDLWQSGDRLSNETLLFTDEEYAYVYVNSMFNQYPELKQARLFDRLVIDDNMVAASVQIEKMEL